MTNQLVIQMVKVLKGASKKNNAPIWSRLAELALKPSSARRTINIGQIDKFVKDNDVIVVPGKVLGTGNIGQRFQMLMQKQNTLVSIKISLKSFIVGLILNICVKLTMF